MFCVWFLYTSYKLLTIAFSFFSSSWHLHSINKLSQCASSLLPSLYSKAHLSQTKSPLPYSVTRVSSGSISVPHKSHFIDCVFVISSFWHLYAINTIQDEQHNDGQRLKNHFFFSYSSSSNSCIYLSIFSYQVHRVCLKYQRQQNLSSLYQTKGQLILPIVLTLLDCQTGLLVYRQASTY